MAMGFRGRVGGSPSAVLFWVMLSLTACAREGWGQAPGPPGEVINQARKALAVTPADNVPLALGPTRSLYIGSACTSIAVILADDTAAVTFSAVPIGTFMPIRAKVVMATGTTSCTAIVGLW